MNINQKSLAVLSSPYLFGVSQVGAAFAALVSYPKGQPRVYSLTYPLSRDGLHSKRRPTKGKGFCSSVIPHNRINRAERRSLAKLEKVS